MHAVVLLVLEERAGATRLRTGLRPPTIIGTPAARCLFRKSLNVTCTAHARSDRRSSRSGSAAIFAIASSSSGSRRLGRRSRLGWPAARAAAAPRAAAIGLAPPRPAKRPPNRRDVTVIESNMPDWANRLMI